MPAVNLTSSSLPISSVALAMPTAYRSPSERFATSTKASAVASPSDSPLELSRWSVPSGAS